MEKKYTHIVNGLTLIEFNQLLNKLIADKVEIKYAGIPNICSEFDMSDIPFVERSIFSIQYETDILL